MHSKEHTVLTRTPQTKDTKRKGMRDKLGADSRDTGCGMSRGGPVRSNLMGICGRETGEERKNPAGPRVHPAGTRGASRRTPGCVPQDAGVRPAGLQGASSRTPGYVPQDPGVRPAGPQGASRRIPGSVQQDSRVRGSTHHFPLLGGFVHSGHHLVMEKQKQRLVRHFPPMPPAPSRLQFSAGLAVPVSPRRRPAPDPESSDLTLPPRPRKAAVDRPRPPQGRSHWAPRRCDSYTPRQD